MRRLAILLSLLAAVTGTPLRQSEAAADLSRSLACLFPSDHLGSPDGGVGDDSGEVALTEMHADFAGDALLTTDPFFLPPALGMPIPSPDEAEGMAERVWWPTAPP
ncbi:hypothetical protein [Tautonia sociabilis]|uniref:Uncharacterized protein n=1 Tax=Tautonia sociabilis TaxID=2080755 RepID=A0A432MPY5_9BACT|nr:hypothetical protein [Tautonia sociabilis]RUL89492.1 hypothetical protein TsocGM_01605 [Tautonia sociabilis]